MPLSNQLSLQSTSDNQNNSAINFSQTKNLSKTLESIEAPDFGGFDEIITMYQEIEDKYDEKKFLQDIAAFSITDALSLIIQRHTDPETICTFFSAITSLSPYNYGTYLGNANTYFKLVDQLEAIKMFDANIISKLREAYIKGKERKGLKTIDFEKLLGNRLGEESYQIIKNYYLPFLSYRLSQSKPLEAPEYQGSDLSYSIEHFLHRAIKGFEGIEDFDSLTEVQKEQKIVFDGELQPFLNSRDHWTREMKTKIELKLGDKQKLIKNDVTGEWIIEGESNNLESISLSKDINWFDPEKQESDILDDGWINRQYDGTSCVHKNLLQGTPIPDPDCWYSGRMCTSPSPESIYTDGIRTSKNLNYRCYQNNGVNVYQGRLDRNQSFGLYYLGDRVDPNGISGSRYFDSFTGKDYVTRGKILSNNEYYIVASQHIICKGNDTVSFQDSVNSKDMEFIMVKGDLIVMFDDLFSIYQIRSITGSGIIGTLSCRPFAIDDTDGGSAIYEEDGKIWIKKFSNRIIHEILLTDIQRNIFDRGQITYFANTDGYLIQLGGRYRYQLMLSVNANGGMSYTLTPFCEGKSLVTNDCIQMYTKLRGDLFGLMRTDGTVLLGANYFKTGTFVKDGKRIGYGVYEVSDERVVVFVNIDEPEEMDMTNEQRRDLKLLNLLDAPACQTVKEYYIRLARVGKNADYRTTIIRYGESISLSQYSFDHPTLRQSIISHPEDFIGQIPAKAMDMNVIDQFVKSLQLVKTNDHESISGGQNQEGTLEGKQDQNNLMNGESSSLGSGDPLEINEKLSELIEIIPGDYTFLSHQSHDLVQGKRVIPNYSYTPMTITDGNIITVTINKPAIMQSIYKPINSVFVLDSLGSTQSYTSNLGYSTLFSDNQDSLTYSYYKMSAQPTIPQTTKKQYESFKHSFALQYGEQLHQHIDQIPLECAIYCDSIKNLDPKEQILMINDFFAQYFYYDWGHGEVLELFNAEKDFSKRMGLMKQRMNCLKINGKSDKLHGKLFAGVCYDAAIIQFGMYRRLGLLCELDLGYQVTGTKLGPHAKCNVLFPGTNNEICRYEIDAVAQDGSIVSSSELLQLEAETKEKLATDQLYVMIGHKTIDSKIAETQKLQHQTELISSIKNLIEQYHLVPLDNDKSMIIAAIKQKIALLGDNEKRHFDGIFDSATLRV